jgi:hypothetical protein
MAKIEMKGFDRLKNAIAEAERRNPKVTAQKVTAIALDLAGRSARQAPVDTGDLRSNCKAVINSSEVFADQKVTGSAAPAEKVEAVVGYSLPYALRQHEELDYNHPKGGKAKFLEEPFLEKEQDYIALLGSIPAEVIP